MESDEIKKKKMETIKLFNQRYCWDMCNGNKQFLHSNFDNFIIYFDTKKNFRKFRM